MMMMNAIRIYVLKIALLSMSLTNQNRVTATYQKPDWSISTINKQTNKKSSLGWGMFVL